MQAVASGNFSGGLVLDQPATILPPNAMSGGQGYVIRESVAHRCNPGATICASPIADGSILLGWTDTNSIEHFFVAGATKIYDVTTTATDRTPAAMPTATGRWSALVFGGAPVLSNPAGQGYYLDSTNSFKAIPYNTTQTWQDVTFSVNALRAYKNFLIGVGYQLGTTDNSAYVCWSDPASPGTLPASWDVADSAYLTGDQPFSGEGGELITGRALRDSFLIYREGAIHRMYYMPDDDSVMGFEDVSQIAGALALDAVASFPKGHAAITTDDIIVCDGLSVQSIAEGSIRKAFFKALCPTHYLRAQAFPVSSKHEIWFAVPTAGSEGYLTDVWIWNWDSGLWSRRQLPSLVRFLGENVSVDADSDEYYDSQATATTFENAEGLVSGMTRGPSSLTVQALRASTTSGLITLSSGFTEVDGTTRTYRIERTGLVLNEAVGMRKHVTEVVLEAVGGAITVRVGAADSAETAPEGYDWGESLTWTPGTTRRMGYRSPSGLYHGIRLTFAADSDTAIHRFSLVGQITGPR